MSRIETIYQVNDRVYTYGPRGGVRCFYVDDTGAIIEVGQPTQQQPAPQRPVSPAPLRQQPQPYRPDPLDRVHRPVAPATSVEPDTEPVPLRQPPPNPAAQTRTDTTWNRPGAPGHHRRAGR